MKKIWTSFRGKDEFIRLPTNAGHSKLHKTCAYVGPGPFLDS